MRKELSLVFACALVAVALVPPPARAQIAGATAGVIWENPTGGAVNCNPPATTGAAVGTCTVSGSASNSHIFDYCQEFASASAPPVGATVTATGCSVSLSGRITAVMSTVGNADETAVHTCVGTGLGTLTYSPAPGSKGVSMSGPVLMTYKDGVLTFEGALINLSTITAGEATGTIIDPCGNDALAHPFAGKILL